MGGGGALCLAGQSSVCWGGEVTQSCSQRDRFARSRAVCCGSVSVLSGGQALSSKCWCSGSAERQRLKAEKTEIIQQVFFKPPLGAQYSFRHRGQELFLLRNG